MRNLQFWTAKFKTVAQEVWDLSCRVRMYEDDYKFWVGGRKLKKMYGHAMNRGYGGIKVHRRRNRWFARRLVCLTKIGTARREAKRLETTKLSFYAKKITELGGVVPNRWS